MVSRIQNRNSGYSENLFSHNRLENTTFNAIDGATALKLDESYQIDEEQSNSVNSFENQNFEEESRDDDQDSNSIPTGVSIESASYIEKSNFEQHDDAQKNLEGQINEEYTPKLFSEDQSNHIEDNVQLNEPDNQGSEELFDQEVNEEEDFEIPAFLRNKNFNDIHLEQ